MEFYEAKIRAAVRHMIRAGETPKDIIQKVNHWTKTTLEEQP
jgi:hypothetical protein